MAELVTTGEGATALARSLTSLPGCAVDLEANGRFAYKARVCFLQIAHGERAWLVDTLIVDVALFREPLGAEGPVKIVHDVAFDARMLAEAGVALGNVHDTAIAAQMLGRASTGLGSLALAELGISMDKSLQGHDWGARPLPPEMLEYLAGDVEHLTALHDKLWAEVLGTGIEAEILEETQYRILSAIASARAPDVPAYARIKGVEKLAPPEQAVLRRLCEARDREARRLDAPATELVPASALIAIVRAKPTSIDALKTIPGAMPRRQGYAVARELLRAVQQGLADGDIPPEERPLLSPRSVPAETLRARRARETRLMAWRRAEAERRKVNEQVVLPGHCLKDLAELPEVDEHTVAGVRGIGDFRLARDAESLMRVLRTEERG